MNIVLWILQIILGLFFIMTGINHFILPPDLPASMAWMYDLPPLLHYLGGTAEILGGLGLILPGIFRIQTRLIPLAAIGLILVMAGALIFHLTRGEYSNAIQNILLALFLAIVAYGRTKKPIPERSKSAEPG